MSSDDDSNVPLNDEFDVLVNFGDADFQPDNTGLSKEVYISVGKQGYSGYFVEITGNMYGIEPSEGSTWLKMDNKPSYEEVFMVKAQAMLLGVKLIGALRGVEFNG